MTRPIDETTQAVIARAMDEYPVCVLPGQHLEDEELIAFSRLYGLLEVERDIGRAADRRRRIASRKIFDISNLDENGGILDENDAPALFMRGNQLWHTDASFKKEAATWSMLHAKAVPPAGGDTEFTDTRCAYDALPDAMRRRLEGSGQNLPSVYLARCASARQPAVAPGRHLCRPICR